MKKFLLIIFILILEGILFSTPVLAACLDPCQTDSECGTNEYCYLPATGCPVCKPKTIPTPTPKIEPVQVTGNACPDNGTTYPPNSACYAEVKRTQSEIEAYPKTCIKEPSVSYEDIRNITGTYGYANCFGKNGSPCDIYVTVTTDLSQAELGSYGPNSTAITSSTTDSLAKKYLFNSLFDRPFYNNQTIPRETWRTYWRLLPINEQFNLVAQFINLVKLSNSLDNDTLKQINNTKWQYLDADGNSQETTVKELADSLPNCLKTEPVCSDFAVVYNNLNADTKAAYDTLIPLSFNNLRGFIAVTSNSVARESLPYIETIFAGLLSQKYGLLGNLQPDWLFSKSQTGLTDTNTAYDLTTGKDNYLSGQFIPSQNKFGDDSLNSPVLANADVTQCPDYPGAYSLSAPRTFPKNSNNTDPSLTQEIKINGSSLNWEVQKTPADHVCVGGWEEQCATPGYYDCISPGVWMCKYPAQWTWIEGKRLCMDDEGDLGYKYCSSNSFLKWIPPTDCENVCTDWDYVCNSPPDHCSEPPVNGSYEECCDFKVTGTGKGRPLTVFNNPKTTDIKQSVIGNSETSLYSTLLPNALLTPTPTDKKISAPSASSNLTGTKNTGSATLTNSGSTIYRENNQAQDTVHLIQNCWLVPSDQQSSSKCGALSTLPTPDVGCDINAPETSSIGITKDAFVGLADGWYSSANMAGECFNDVINRSLCAGINPMYSLMMWLHESDASNYTMNWSGPVEDFGIHMAGVSAENFNEQITKFLTLDPGAHCLSDPRINGAYWLGWMTNMLNGSCDPDEKNSFSDMTGREALPLFVATWEMLAGVGTPMPTTIHVSQAGQSCP